MDHETILFDKLVLEFDDLTALVDDRREQA
jgi:hypothetical protein